jgi:hypothetical protein
MYAVTPTTTWNTVPQGHCSSMRHTWIQEMVVRGDHSRDTRHWHQQLRHKPLASAVDTMAAMFLCFATVAMSLCHQHLAPVHSVINTSPLCTPSVSLTPQRHTHFQYGSVDEEELSSTVSPKFSGWRCIKFVLVSTKGRFGTSGKAPMKRRFERLILTQRLQRSAAVFCRFPNADICPQRPCSTTFNSSPPLPQDANIVFVSDRMYHGQE